MSNQLQITGGAKVRNLEGVITGSTGVLNSLPINGANGIPQLDSNGKILVSQLPNSVMEFKGTWNAATNTPYLHNGTGNTGDVYLCNVAGSVDFGAGSIYFAVGDYAVYDGTNWDRASGATGTVTSVAVTESSAALSITGSPITTSGTINIGFAGTSAQYVAGDGSLITFPTIITQAQNLVTEVYNETGATLTKGTIIYINGGHGNLPTITKAIATSDATSAQTYGVVREDITDHNNGYVTVIGNLENIDTQAYAAGTQLYLSSTTAGAWTDVKQYAPAHLVYVGVVVRSHPTQGVVEVKIQNGYELDELHNVSAQSPSNGNILQYVSSTQLWTSVAGTTTNIAEGTNLYFTDARVRAALSATTPLSFNSSTGAFSISQANTSTNGYLSSTDWNTFNNKQNALGFLPIGGSGSVNYIAKFTGSTTISNSIIYDDGTTAQIGGSLTVQGTLLVSPSSGFPQATILGAGTTELRIQTSSATYTSDIKFTSGPTATYGLLRYDNTNNYLTIYANSIAYSRLFNNGNFVIGSTLTDSGFKLEVQGTAKINGQLTLGSTITNGTYTYSLPSATGTLALTSQIPSLTGYVVGTGTPGYVTYWNGTSNVTGTNNFYWDSANNRLGINNATPTFSLDVAGTSRLNNASGMGLQVNGGTFTQGTSSSYSLGIGNGGGYDLTLGTSSTAGVIQTWSSKNLALNPQGNNVGIGNNSPIYTLDVSGQGRFTNQLSIGATLSSWSSAFKPLQTGTYGGYIAGRNDDNSMFLGINHYYDGSNWIYTTTNPVSQMYFSGDNIIFRNNTSGTSGTATGFNERMRINSSGVVLVGTSSVYDSLTKFSVNESTQSTYLDIVNTGSSDSVLRIIGTNYGQIQNKVGALYISNTAATGDMIFRTGSSTERMRIMSTGNIRTFVTPSVDTNIEWYNTSSGTIAGRVWADGNPRMNVQCNSAGGVYLSSAATSWASLSDETLKNITNNIENATDKLGTLRAVHFEWKSDNDKNDNLGLIAQDIEKVFPQIVDTDKDGIKGVKYTELIPVLVAAIKELKAEIDELKNK